MISSVSIRVDVKVQIDYDTRIYILRIENKNDNLNAHEAGLIGKRLFKEWNGDFFANIY